ncbi:MAG: EAL domain-containing protein [Pseudomonadota bacterium]
MRAFLAILLLCLAATTARALEPVPVGEDVPVVDLLPFAELQLDEIGDLQVSTAPDADGVVQRIEVRATTPDTRHWAVVGLRNPGDGQIDRLLVAPHHRLANSGVLAPDLGAPRINAITPSEGFPPERVPSTDADVFLITLDPGATVTYVMELATPNLPMLRLWQPDAFSDSQNAYTLYKGVVVGISGLLALFFLVVFVIKGQMMFAAAAVLAWTGFSYILIDFAFLSTILNERVTDQAVFRAFAEAMLVLALAAFVVSYLNVKRWRFRNTYALLILLPLGAASAWLATFDPALTASTARVALALVALAGLFLILVAAIRGNERAVMLLPTWGLLIAWITGAAMTVGGDITNDFVQPALNGGLVLIVLLIGFTVMQHAFAGASIAPSLAKDVERDVMALAGSGDTFWDWDVMRDRIACGPEVEHRLGLERGDLQAAPQDWYPVIHPQDRDRFRATLDAAIERRRGRINDLFRFRGVDGHFRWFRLAARPVIGTTGEIIRCVGTMHDVTEAKTIEERLLHDSVYDNLTGLPNRHLFLDRIEMARAWSNEETAECLYVAIVNPDAFSELNDTFGTSVGDSALLTIARRLSRILKRHDSIARLSSDGFGILVYCDPGKLDEFTDRVRETLATPIPFADEEIIIKVSIGVARIDLKAESATEILDNAELALRRAKRQGGDTAELFDPLMRRLNMSGRSLARDLKRAISEEKVKLAFRPIQDLEKGGVVGYEALPTWHHPLQGPLGWAELLELASTEDLAVQLALTTMERCTQTLAAWRQAGRGFSLLLPLPHGDALRSELIGDVKTAIARNRLDFGALQLGVPEDLVSGNPELAVQLFGRLRDVGASPWLIDFARRTTALPNLARLPVDGVRFHAGLTVIEASNPKKIRLAASLFRTVTALEAKVMVGGVQNLNEAKALHQMGARYAVGGAFGRPVSANAAVSAAVPQAAAAE